MADGERSAKQYAEEKGEKEMNKEYVIHITPDNLVRVEELDPAKALEDFRRLCGGNIQTVPARLEDWDLILAVDEEGKLKGADVNILGTVLTMKALPADRIVGPAVLCKEGIRDGEPDLVGFERKDANELADRLVRAFLRFLDTVKIMD